MKKLINVMDKVLSTLCITICVTLVLCIIWQVVSRIMGSPSTLTDEIARFMFIWVGLIGAAYTLGQKRHLAIDLLILKLEKKPKAQADLALLINVIGLVFVGLIMLYGGGNLMLKTLASKQLSPVLQLKMGWVYSAIPLSGCFMLIYLVDDIIKIIKQKFSHSTPPSNVE